MSKEEGLGSRLKSLFTRPKRQNQAALNTAEDRKPYAVSAEHLQVRFQTGQPKMGLQSGTVIDFRSRSPPKYPMIWTMYIYSWKVGKP